MAPTGNELWAHVPAPASIASIQVPANGHYTTGQVLTFQFFFNQPVFVTGTPYIQIVIGSTVRNVPYLTGSGTNRLVFRYTIQSSDHDTNGIEFNQVPPNSGKSRIFRPSGSDIKDADGVSLTLAGVSFTMPSLSGITVN
jgi:hypothetical protein